MKSTLLSENYLHSLLHLLPQSLDKTYERIFCSIEDRFIEDVRRILTLVRFAARPLSVLELVEKLAVEINLPRLNTKSCLQDTDHVLEICLGLVDFNISDMDIKDIDMTEPFSTDEQTQTVRIAHFSVQEYLESERIQRQKVAIFSLSSASAHAEIAQISLIY